MPQAVQARVFRPAVFIDNARPDLRWLEPTLDDVRVVLDRPGAGREHKLSFLSRSVFATIGGNGTVRSPATLLGLPIAP